MNTCNKNHKITVSMREDGDLDVNIVSDCKNVQEYAKNINVIGMSDLMDRHSSKILDPSNSAMLSTPCLVQQGVLDAAWMEVGILSKSLCNKVHSNEVILDQMNPDTDEQS